MADIARCIQKAAYECFEFHTFVNGFFHFIQNLKKKMAFIPSENLWLLLQHFINGEISEKFFQDKWIEEESKIDVELKGYEYIYKMANNFAPKPFSHKRGILSSQRIEMLNRVFKKRKYSIRNVKTVFANFYIIRFWP